MMEVKLEKINRSTPCQEAEGRRYGRWGEEEEEDV